jgi:hypothetical protein
MASLRFPGAVAPGGADAFVSRVRHDSNWEDVDELWLADAVGRLNAYDAGTASARDIDDALAEIEKQLR